MEAFFVPGREHECVDQVRMMCDKNIKSDIINALFLHCQCEAKLNYSYIIIWKWKTVSATE